MGKTPYFNKTDCLHLTEPAFVMLSEHDLDALTIKNTRLINYTLVTEFGRKNHKKRRNINFQEQKSPIQSGDFFHAQGICEIAAVKIHMNQRKLST